MAVFFLAVLGLIITPGPGVLTTAGVGSGFGFAAGRRFLAGLFVGTNLVAVLVASGMAAIVLSAPVLRTILLFLSIAYLCYLALRIAFSGRRIGFIHSDAAPGFWNGVMLQFINPKAYVVNTTLFSGFAFMPENLMVEIVLKFVIINLIWIPVHFLWLWAGVALRRLNLPDRMQFAINIAMAVSMLLAVALAAFGG